MTTVSKERLAELLAKATPGPWTTDRFGSSVVGLGVWAAGGRHVAGLALPCQGEPATIAQFRDEQHANAALIALAPDMARELQRARLPREQLLHLRAMLRDEHIGKTAPLLFVDEMLKMIAAAQDEGQ